MDDHVIDRLSMARNQFQIAITETTAIVIVIHEEETAIESEAVMTPDIMIVVENMTMIATAQESVSLTEIDVRTQ